VTLRHASVTIAFTLVAAGLGWVLFVGVPNWYGQRTVRPGAATAPAAPPVPGRKIKARLFYVAEDGTRLVSVERDVSYGDGAIEQAKAIVEAQIAPVAEPWVSPVPPGTKLRALFVTQKGEAYVDLSREVAAEHPGGSLNEMLTIYAIVDALTVNLPAVTRVQVLVEGKEVDTLAGHVDLRRPLLKNLAWVEQAESP
jgi:spore germination protein GerM